MRTFRYHKDCPEGKIFDTEPGMPDPLVPPKGTGWVEHRSELQMTKDEVVAAAVKQELARQSTERDELEAEHKKKFGYEPRAVESD